MTGQATSAPPPVRKTGKRTRLSPQLRKTQILDDAARLILEEGLTAVSMERLGREAGISKAKSSAITGMTIADSFERKAPSASKPATTVLVTPRADSPCGRDIHTSPHSRKNVIAVSATPATHETASLWPANLWMAAR